MRHTVFTEEPTIEGYRLDYCPRDGLGPVLVCIWANLTGESGKSYNVMRACQLPGKNESMNFGTYELTGDVDSPGKLVYSFKDYPAVEPFRTYQDRASIVYEGDSFRFALGVTEHLWCDAGGNVKLRAERLGQVVSYWVPHQEGYEHPTLERSTLGKATGTIGNDSVEGLYMVDVIYSRPDLTFGETMFTRKIHNYWMNWLIEYEDGELEGGFAWRGQPGSNFAAAHHYRDGVSRARSDALIEVERTERGSMRALTLSLGKDVRVRFDQRGSYDWPIHTQGVAVETLRDKPIKKSWNYSENFPLNWGLVEDYQLAYANLHGRYPSLQGLLDGARIVDGRIVFRQPPRNAV
jgi:hypothetical protein